MKRQRIISLFVTFAMCLSMISNWTWAYAAGETNTEATEDTDSSGQVKNPADGPLFNIPDGAGTPLTDIDVDNATHFIIRHWHGVSPKGTLVDEEDESLDEYAIVLEGYIVPDTTGGISVDQAIEQKKFKYYGRAYDSKTDDSDSDDSDSDEPEVFLEINSDVVGKSAYIGAIGDITVATEVNPEYKKEEDKSEENDPYLREVKSGAIEIKVTPYNNGKSGDDYKAYESFAGFSISGGQSSITLDAEKYDRMTVSYDKNVHVTKCHVFYINEMTRESGIAQRKLPGTGSVGGNGGNGETEATMEPAPFPDGVDAISAPSKKYYNNNDGMFTDKTAVAREDGRTFDVYLQSWYNGFQPANVGMVLDASGSMAYTVKWLDEDNQITIIDNDGTGNVVNADKMAGDIKANPTTIKGKRTIGSTVTQFLTDDELKYYLNPRDSDNSPLGVAGYTYYIYDGKDTAKEYVPLAYWAGDYGDSNGTIVAKNGNKKIGTLENDIFKGIPGWYYVNFHSELKTYAFNPGAQSGKTLWGVGSGAQTYKDGSNTTYDRYLPRKYQYTNNTPTSAVKFFISEDGKLCALGSTKNDDKNKWVSYVYKAEDSDYTKKEALQRALGTFTTKLADESPLSKVSAVRFSIEEARMTNYLNTLPSPSPGAPAKTVQNMVYPMFVMLDWIHNSYAAANMLSLEYGYGDNKGGPLEGTKHPYDSNPDHPQTIPQYNYVLTGGTNTDQGLKVFERMLANMNETTGKSLPTSDPNYNYHIDDDSKKYVIIFTDGQDSLVQKNGENPDAVAAANYLKNAGYTILCVLLATGTVREGEAAHDSTINFLKGLAGAKDTASAKKDDYVFVSADPDTLTEQFSEKILNDILENLEGYTMQDYIDPRFDIIGFEAIGKNDDAKTKEEKKKNEIVWHLNAGGKVTINGVEETIPPEGKDIILNHNGLYEGSEAKLHYDSGKEMYYLVWTDQEIHGNVSGSDKLKAWDALVTLRAKEDFIGGNGVLIGGNGQKQNYVYNPEDNADSISSGVDDMYRTGNTPSEGWKNYVEGKPKEEYGFDDYPSKGFPRVVVNVAAPVPCNIPSTDNIYMGEHISVSLQHELENIVDSWDDDETAPDDDTQLYYDYLKRYVNIGKYVTGIADKDKYASLDALLTAIAQAGESGLTIPYYYLPDADELTKATNQTGTSAHRGDLMGSLTYKFVNKDSTASQGDAGDGTTKNLNKRSYDLTITYNPIAAPPTPSPAPSKSHGTEEENEEGISLTAVDTDRSSLIAELVDDGEYKWNTDYKPVSGTAVGEKSGGSSLTTTIVGGDIKFDMVLSADTVELMNRYYLNNPLTYKADLKRGTETVGTFTATYTPSATKTGKQVVAGTLEFTDAYKYLDAIKHLPIGTYTLDDTGYENTAFLGLKFSDNIEIKTGNDVATKFTNITDVTTFSDAADAATDAAKLVAPVEGTSILLGTKAYTDAEDRDYTNDRYGYATIDVDPVVDNLTISKTVVANDTDKANDSFEFTVTLENANSPITCTYVRKDVSGSDAVVSGEIESGEPFTLKDGESITIIGIPHGAKYSIKETGVNRYEPEYKIGSGGTGSGNAGADLTTGEQSITAESGIDTVVFTNTKKYILTYDPNDGPTDCAPDPDIKLAGTKVDIKDVETGEGEGDVQEDGTYTKDGRKYKFRGWSKNPDYVYDPETSPDDENFYEPDDDFTITQDETIYAVWEDVTPDPSPTATASAEPSPTATAPAEPSPTATAPAEPSPTATPRVRLKYHPNGGPDGCEPPEQTGAPGEDVPVQDPVEDLEDVEVTTDENGDKIYEYEDEDGNIRKRRFKGWSKDPNYEYNPDTADKEHGFYEPGDDFTLPDEDDDLYAVWEDVEDEDPTPTATPRVRLKYHPNGGPDGCEPPEQTGAPGEDVPVQNPVEDLEDVDVTTDENGDKIYEYEDEDGNTRKRRFKGWSKDPDYKYDPDTADKEHGFYEPGDDFTLPDEDDDLYAVWEDVEDETPSPSPTPTAKPSSPHVSGGSSKPKYTLHYETNGGNDIDDEKYNPNAKAKVDKEPKRPGYIFDGWYSDPELTEEVSSVVMDKDKTVYAKWTKEPAEVPDMLNGDDHYAYIIGYPEGDVRPSGNITRAEVATIFFRMLTDEARSKYWTSKNSYSDVPEESWYDNAISTATNAGIVKGYLDGSFAPNAPITRAEFAAIAARFDSGTYTGDDYFSDIADHWANEYINRAAQRGWVNGYEDGTFKPDQTITRAEAMTLVNNVLNRKPGSADKLANGMIEWVDNSDKSAWYYLAVQEATNSHEYDRDDDDSYEQWTNMLPVRDWEAFEKIWSDANSASNPGDVVKRTD